MRTVTSDLLDRVDLLRLAASRRRGEDRKAALGQFFTPMPIARLMASMLACPGPRVTILDPGAGVGSLFAACVAELAARPKPPRQISVTAYEVDPQLQEFLADTVALCRLECERVGIRFSAEIRQTDFIQSAAELLRADLFSQPAHPAFACVVLNPPYKKINTDSAARLLLRRIGIETSNLYTGFLAAALQLLQPGGELVAITPRSFCNGTYFRAFRQFFLNAMTLRRLHLFESRQHAFRDDAVLQENLIVHAVKGRKQTGSVNITSSREADDELMSSRTVVYGEVIR